MNTVGAKSMFMFDFNSTLSFVIQGVTAVYTVLSGTKLKVLPRIAIGSTMKF